MAALVARDDSIGAILATDPNVEVVYSGSQCSASQRSGSRNSLVGLANIGTLGSMPLPVRFGTNKDQAESHISSGERFVVSSSTMGPVSSTSGDKHFLSYEKTLPIRASFAQPASACLP